MFICQCHTLPIVLDLGVEKLCVQTIEVSECVLLLDLLIVRPNNLPTLTTLDEERRWEFVRLGGHEDANKGEEGKQRRTSTR